MERNYLIINTSEISKVDFNQILETSEDTLRLSVNGEKTFIKWIGSIPDFVSTFSFSEGPYSNEEILTILSSSEWTDQTNY
jgi:hypothetical protein